jgi:hypothetical protein
MIHSEKKSSTHQPIYTAQARLDFDIAYLLQMGIKRAYVTPFAKNNECFCEPEIILNNLEKLKKKADLALLKGLCVYPLFITIGHPEGNFAMPARYRQQQNLDGSLRPGFVCFSDAIRQSEMLRFIQKATELGFARIAFDDDLRDAFCYCDEHLNGFRFFREKPRDEIKKILNGVLTNSEYEKVRCRWYEYKYEGMKKFAHCIEKTVHGINPACQIGIFNSAKRCEDFSGRNPWRWASLFHTEQAPVFVRLCGECYDDQLMHLVQSTGWHDYSNQCYPAEIERMLEISSVSAINYRSPGAILLESAAVEAATGLREILWAWTDDYINSDMPRHVSSLKESVNSSEMHKNRRVSPIAVYIGHELGPYTPPNISIDYGATHDPITAYNITSLVGLPTTVTPVIKSEFKVIICSAFISREMTDKIDEYIAGGGVCILDSVAAKCYRWYDGNVEFEINGPVSLARYEMSPDGQREDTIADCPADSIFHIKSLRESQKHCWTGYDVRDDIIGQTTVIKQYGKGSLIVLGYDLSRAGTVLIRPAWRQRLLKVLSMAGINLPTYWSGPVAVQLFLYDNIAAMVNYNANSVNGDLVINNKTNQNINLKPFSIKYVDIIEP